MYFTKNSDFSIQYAPAWTPGKTAQTQTPTQQICAFDKVNDPLFSPSSSAINDVAVTNSGMLLIAGRQGTRTDGYILLVDPAAQKPGQPCVYTKILTTPFVIAGLGSSSKSDVFLGTGDDKVFGYKIDSDPVTGAITASIIGNITSGLGGGAGDITAAPGRSDLGEHELAWLSGGPCCFSPPSF